MCKDFIRGWGNKPEYPTTTVQCEDLNRLEQFHPHLGNASLAQTSLSMQAQVSQTVPGYSQPHHGRRIQMPRQRQQLLPV